MGLQENKIAIISPSQNAYSETFIQAHKNHLSGKVYYYFGSIANLNLEGEGILLKGAKKIYGKFLNLLLKKKFYSEKKALLNSWKKKGINLLFFEYGTTAGLFIDVIKESKIPLIVHFHGYDASMYSTIKEFEKQYAQIFDYATYIVVVSEVMKEKLLELGCPRDKLVKNIYGPNNLFLDCQPNFSKQQFISVGRFTNKKAPYYTLLAFKEVLSEFPEAKLIMGGDGNLLETCENICKYYQLENSVFFDGIITPEKYKQYLTESLAFVQHSIIAKNGDMEGTPLAILESSAAGLPVIASRHAGISEVITDKKTGLLFEEHDVKKMAEHMKTILRDKEYAISLGLRGKENIRTYFSMKKHIDTLDRLILKAIQS
ncbi:MAG TPA: glycosyltransferase family 4 protein [Flavobacterium sp.]|uniref:glycosyltransferase family 4 protein n=1 Tax=Flavobacterium sp. TaxID=239 RepID=UPI002ED44C3D